MISSAISQSGTAVRAADTEAAPSAARMSKQRDFHVTNALGTTLATFDSEDLARSWVRRHIERFPSIRVERVTVWIDRQIVYRPRAVKPQRQEMAA